MLTGLDQKVRSDRQLRHFVCACSRRLWHRLTDEARHYVESAERLVGGEAPDEGIGPVDWGREVPDGPALARCCLWQDAAYGSPYYYWMEIQEVLSERHGGDEAAARADLLRDVCGIAFRKHRKAKRGWRTETVLALARQMYATRDFSVMPILADALQDAGCGDEQILSHCRDRKQVHARGCWVVDLILGNR